MKSFEEFVIFETLSLTYDKKMAKKKNRDKIKKSPKVKVGVSKNKENLTPIIAVLVVTALVFANCLSNDFVNWDDDVNILENTNLDGFTAENIGRIFHPEHGRVIGNYNPLPIFTFAIEKAIFGLNPTVFHFNNLLLHLICVFFVFLLGKRMGLSPLASGLLALLFGIHPMRVESVAWATERKDVLFGVFYLGAMLTYIRFLTEKHKKYLWWTVGLFVLSLFSKIQAVSLPLTLLALDYWFKRDLNFKLIIEKIPFWALSLAFGIAGIIFLGEDGSLDDATNFSFFERLLVGAYSYCVYVVKWIFPYRKSPMYPYPAGLTTPFYTAPLLVAGFVGLFFVAFKKNWRVVVFGLAFFTFNIMFLLQILAAGQGYIADRFTYMAYFGLFFMAAYAFDYLLKNKAEMKTAVMGVTAAVLLGYAFMSFQQVKIWENGKTLWTHVNKYYDYVTTPWINLGHYYRDRKEVNPAINHYTKAIEINGNKGQIYNSRGKLYLENGKPELALADFTKGVKASPKIAEIHINQGAAFGTLGNYKASLASLNKGLALDPENKNGYSNRAMLYTLLEDHVKAIQDHTAYLKLNPNNANIWFEQGQAYNIVGNPQKALESLNRAIQINPNNKTFYQARARANAALGNNAAAQADAQRAG